MWIPTKDDFEIIKSWGLDKDPFKAISDYSEEKSKLRWKNPEHIEAHERYTKTRLEMCSDGFQQYYKTANRPLTQDRWEYNMIRKEWGIIPLGWDEIAKNAITIADFGCGDGDTIQRLINFIDRYWKIHSISPRKIRIIGFDLGEDRIENARKFVHSDNPDISIEFHVVNIIENGINYPAQFFDYGLITGVIEILEDPEFNKFMDRICHYTKHAIFLTDLLDKFPGGYPRPDLTKDFHKRNFKIDKRYVVFSEPFNLTRLQEPKKIFPILEKQNIWAVRIS
ncbi:MAG: class I SAM-dependent methyltransferase [Nitrososphaera sp.]|jgi:ubiquinone/menaquinone biosynthesis C-methylase UbiE